MIAGAAYHADGSVTLRFPYDRALVERIKATIPGRARTYNPGTKCWTVFPPHDQAAVRLLHAFFPGEVAAGRRPPPMAPTPLRPVDAAFQELHLLPSAPDEVVEAAYKCLARHVHPDVGGDAEAMRRLNEAIATLRRRRVAAS